MSIEPYHLSRYSCHRSTPRCSRRRTESHDLVNHRVESPFKDFTIQDELNFDTPWSSLCLDETETETAVNVNGNDQIETSGNVNEKNLEDDGQIPRIGMKFSSESEAREFYKNYAEKIGFTVRKGKVQKNVNGQVTWRCFLCSCEGFRSRKRSIQDTKKYQRSETRTGCDAQIQVKLETGEWVITKLHLEHNHMLNCLDTVNGLLHEEEGAFGANKEIQTSLASTEAEVRDETLTDPNTVAEVLEMVEESTRESIWQQILAKYGDVTANCSFSVPTFRAQFVEFAKDLIPKIVELMQKKTAHSLSKADICYINSALSDLERGNIEVVWLRRKFDAVVPLVEYVEAEGKRDMIRRRLDEKIAEVEQLYLELDQVEASLQELQHRIPDWLRIEDTLGEGLL